MSTLRLGVSLQPRWPLDDGAAVLRAARHAEDLGFDHVAVGNRLLDSGFGLDAAAAFLTPPGIPVPSPCTMWLPVAAENVAKAMEWIAAKVMPQLN